MQKPRRAVEAPGFIQSPPVNSAYVRQEQLSGGNNGTGPRKPVDGKRRSHPLLNTCLALVLCLGLLTFGFLMVPSGTEGTLGQIRSAVADTLSSLLIGERKEATLQDFSCANATSEAPAELVFTLTTGKAVQAVRIVDENGTVLLVANAPVADNAMSRSWVLTLMHNSVYTASVHCELLTSGEWQVMSKVINVSITLPSAASEAGYVPTPAPTQAPEAAPETETVPAAAEAPAAEEEEPEGDAAAENAAEAPAEAPTEVPADAPTKAPAEAPTEAPTPTPTPKPTPTPTPTPEPTPTPTPGPTAVPTTIPGFSASADGSTDPELLKLTEEVYDGASKKSSYRREAASVIQMPAGEAYASLEKGDYYETIRNGVVTFRGNAFRQNAAFGTVEGLTGLSQKWKVSAGSLKATSKTYYGTEFGSQPAIVKWSREVRQTSNIKEGKQSVVGLKEVILAGADGKIRFLDLADGTETRSAIDLKYPLTTSVSVHPSGYPLMAVGQATRKVPGGKEIALRVYDLLTQKVMYSLDGTDGKLKRPYNTKSYAFNTTPLIDPRSDTMIAIGTNGLLYTTKLSTAFDWNVGNLSIRPSTIVMRSKTAKQKGENTAVESSLAAYLNYVYYVDATGVLHCVDTTTMKTVWLTKTGDKVQAAVALDFDEDERLWVYVANTLQNRAKGDCTISRFDALTGEPGWTYTYGTKKVKKSEAVPGAMASPIMGQHGISDYVIYTVSSLKDDSGIANLESGAEGAVVALRKKDGSVAWSRALDSYSHSSPVAVYSEDGRCWILQASHEGTLYCLNGENGEVVATMDLQGKVEGSPAVYNDTLVIGTTGRDTSWIWGITLENGGN